MQRAISRNTLFYGDNLAILREYIPDESVDLIYLDPPFNSNRSYNVLFKEESGSEAEAQITRLTTPGTGARWQSGCTASWRRNRRSAWSK